MTKINIDGKSLYMVTPCVYGPPSWYNSDGTFDRSNPEVEEFLIEIEEIKEKNRKRKEIHDRLQEDVDQPIGEGYEPEPPIEMKTDKSEYVDKPISLE